MSVIKQKVSNNAYWLSAFVVGFTALTLFMVASLGRDIEQHSLKQIIYHYADAKREQSIDSIDLIADDAWVENTHQNFGLRSAPQWLKVDFVSTTDEQVLEIDYAMLDNIQLWFRKKVNDKYVVSHAYQIGDSLAFTNRPIIHDKFLIPFPDEPEGLQLLLKIQSNGTVKAPLKLWMKQDYIVYTASHRLFMGLFFGYMAAMGLINVFLFMTTRSKTFIIYAAYVFSFAMLIATINGLGFRFIWPDSPWLQERSPAIFAYLAMSFILVFSSQILNLKAVNPKWYLVFKILYFVYFIAAIASFLVPYVLMLKCLFVLLLISIPIILFVSLRLAFNGSDIAKYFSAAWLTLLIPGLIVTANNFQWISLSIDTSYLLMMGATTETLLLALALATSYSAQKREAQKAQTEADEDEVRALQAQDEVLQLQNQSQKKLEEQVLARTKEFEKALAGLSQVNEELKGLSETDTLTGLSNRRFFEKNMLIEAARSRREKKPLAIALLDIDHFKAVNDTFGHQCGDDCLVAFAKTLRSVILRPGDIISRYGGEEFVVMLPNTSVEGAKAVLEQFRLAVESLQVETQGHIIQFTVSTGVTARVIGDDDDCSKMLVYADKLLYQAKEAGRNRIKSGNF